MKNLIFAFAFLSIISLNSCNSADKNKAEAATKISDSKSVVYKEVVKTLAGDFAGFSIGASFADSKKVISKDFLTKEESDFLMYKISDKYTVSEYTLIFEDGKLIEIALDTDIYDETDNSDSDAALLLFNDLKDDFLERFGSKYLETETDDNTVLFWSDDKKEIQLIKENGKVHVYIDKLSEEEIVE